MSIPPSSPESPRVHVYQDDALKWERSLDGPLEVGRQRAGELGPYHFQPATDSADARLVVAAQQDKDNFSRKHLTLTPLPDGRVRVENHSKADLPRDDDHAHPVAAGTTADLQPPFRLSLPGRGISVGSPDSADEHGVHHLREPSLGPGRLDRSSLAAASLDLLRPAQLRALLEGVPRAMNVLQSAVGAADFLGRAAQALVEIVGLDTGRVLLRRTDDWHVAAAHGTPADAAFRPSRHVVERLLQTRSAVWQKPQQVRDPDSASLRLLDAVVAAPLLDRKEEVVGILYGERRKDSPQAGRADSQVEVLLVDLLACGVATGLARLEQEQAALKTSALLEQFFTPDLAPRFATDPAVFQGKDADVTVLFADVRGYSRHSERLGAATSIRWMNDVLDALSKCVRDEDGVLVDYVGDELMAMWGAPDPQPDQAARAVRAALAMHAALPALNATWEATLGEKVGLGVGVNSGPAQVGNVGSRLKFKYGPLGNTVNVASRVQGLTKYLGCGVLVTAAARRQLDPAFVAWRVVRARLVNIEEPVDLFEVERAGVADRRAFFAEADMALEELEARKFAQAARLAGQMLLTHSGDGPLLLTLTLAAEALMRAGAGFDPVWTPPGK